MSFIFSSSRIRSLQDRLRSFPKPRYVSGTPRVADAFPKDVFQVPNPMTLAAAALSEEAICFVTELIDRLTPSEEIAGQQAWYQLARAQFGSHLRFADLTTTLWAAATLFRPGSYLEIGVRRGRSVCVVGAIRPDCAIYGFDLWLPDYAGVPNPGPGFVRNELLAVGHHGLVDFTSGDSRETIPAFLDQRPDLFFDVITVDGDHTGPGAATDLTNVLPRLKIGGIVLFDDIATSHDLGQVWDRLVKRDSRYVTWEFTDAGDGIAAAIRHR